MTATLRDLLDVVFRFKRALLTFWIVTVLAILIFYTQTPRKYDSRARILVSLGSENAGRAEYLNSSNLQLIQREQQIHNEQQILLSDHVLLTTAKWILGEPTPGDPPPPMDERVAEARRYLTGEEPEPTALLRLLGGVGRLIGKTSKLFSSGRRPVNPIPESKKLANALAKGLDAKTIFNSDALDVTFRYRDARVAQTVLRLILAAYMDHHIAVFQSAAESGLLKSELDRSVEEYQQRLNEMANFMETKRVFSEDTQINSLIQQRQQINQALGDATADRESAAARIASFDALNNSLKRYETYSTIESRNKIHDELESKLSEAQVQQQQILNNHPAESRVYQDQVQVLQRIRELLSSQPAQITDQREDRRSGASELVEQQLINSATAEKSAHARVDQFRHELANVNESINAYAQNLPGYDLIKLNLNFSKEQSEKMGQAYLNSRLRVLTAQNAITDISIIDAPSWDPDTATPKRSMFAVLSFALLLLGSVAVILLGVGLDATISDRRDALALGVPTAAVIPLVTTKGWDSPNLLNPQTENEFAQIYSSLRRIGRPGTVVSIAGAVGGEGVSAISLELARYLARTRRSRVGLLDYTATTPSASSSDVHGVTFLSLPQEDKEGANGFALSAELLETWTTQYEYIVFANNVSKDIYKLVEILPLVDRVYLVIEQGKTRKATAANALALLRNYGVREIQVILNKRAFWVPEWLVRRI